LLSSALAVAPLPGKGFVSVSVRVADTLEIAAREENACAACVPMTRPASRIFSNRLSPTARRYRFFSPVKSFSEEMVTRLVDVDRRRECALAVVCLEHGKEISVGGGRFVVEDSGAGCEFSLLVGDDWQGQGVGRRILATLIERAARRGVQRIAGDVLAENRGMIALGRALKFQVTASDEGPAVLRLVRELAPSSSGLLERLVRKLGRWRRKIRRPRKP
jgi:GNAT superfamily N-acetyltransferase